MIGTGAFRLKSYTPNRARRARPLPGLLGRKSAARRSSPHLLRRYGTSGARVAGGSARPLHAAFTAGSGALPEQQPLQGLHRADVGTQDVRPACRPGSLQGREGTAGHRINAQPPGPASRGSSWGRGHSATTRRSGRSSRPSDRSTNQRKQNVALARALLQAAGQPNPKFTITTWRFIDLPDYATASSGMGREVAWISTSR